MITRCWRIDPFSAAVNTISNPPGEYDRKVETQRNRMVEAVKGIGLWNEVKNDPNYKNLKTDSQIADEVYSRLIIVTGKLARKDCKSRQQEQTC